MDGEIITTDTDINTEVVMSKEEAQELTESIQSTAIATCVLLQRAHDKKAWKSLGYKTWAEYVDAEFKFSRARSYQLLNQGSVIEQIVNASESDVYLTEKEAKSIQKELPRITARLKDETKDIDDEDDRREKTKAIVEDEVAKTAKQDNETFESEVDAPVSTQDDWRPQGGDASLANSELAEKHQQEEQSKQTSFYVENLNRTLSIIQAMPSADGIADSADMAEDEKIKLRNDLKYAITWMNDLIDRIS